MEVSQLRQDPISHDWVVIAPGRANRSKDKFKRVQKRKTTPARTCVFEDLEKATTEPVLLQYGGERNWSLAVIENKYPAVSHHELCPVPATIGPYQTLGAVGRHEIVITRSHKNNFADLKPQDAADVFLAFQERTHAFKKDSCLEYVSHIQNWGEHAGASQPHPHYQIIALPVLPPHVQHSLDNAQAFHAKSGKCGHCEVMRWEEQNKTRVIYENKHAIAIAPFASKNCFEFRVFPKRHESFFELSSEQSIAGVTAVLQKTLAALSGALKDPDYNFYIHTAPLKNQGRYGKYHWHVEVLPKTNIPAGFELGTGIIINEIDPDVAAATLRKHL